MSVIKTKIFATALSCATIDVSQDNQVPIELELVDYTIPSGASVIAFARGKYSGKTYKTPCTFSGNVVTLVPPVGFFVPGPNVLQVEINEKIIPFSMTANCKERVSNAGSPSTPEPIVPYVERAEAAAKKAEESQKAAGDSATAARSAANSAGSAAAAAANSASSASQSAAGAASSATKASSSATDAGNSKTAAAKSATNAAESAKQSEQSASDAKTSANKAGTSESNSKASETNASTSAGAAAKSAESAQSSKTAAAGSATAAAKSASSAKDYYDKTAAIVVSTPYIGDNGHWYIYSLSQDKYVDSGMESRGAPPTVNSSVSEYQIASNGTTVPGGAWLQERPVTPQGQYLWTRVTAKFATGNVVWYTVDYRAIDGEQSVASEIGLRVVDGALCQVFIG